MKGDRRGLCPGVDIYRLKKKKKIKSETSIFYFIHLKVILMNY